jgi:hypothetical protein
VTKRWWLGFAGYAVVTALAFLILYWVLALLIAVMGATVLVVAAMARSWDEHSTFEEREMRRARKRKEKFERNAGARAKDRARWEAHQARKGGQG